MLRIKLSPWTMMAGVQKNFSQGGELSWEEDCCSHEGPHSRRRLRHPPAAADAQRAQAAGGFRQQAHDPASG